MVCLAAMKPRSAFRSLLVALPLLLIALQGGLVRAQGQAGMHQTSGGKQYAVRSGDTLDRIISQQIGASPFSIVFLRDALARMNPQSLPQGARGTLLAGTVMQIPDACMLGQMAFGEQVGCGGVGATPPSNGRPGPMSAAERMEIERRSWVRYP